MPEFDGTAAIRTCVDVSDVLINVASDRSHHQCYGSCMVLAWLLLLCQFGCQKWKVFQCCCRCVGFVAAAVTMSTGGCRARRPVVDVSVAAELAVL